MPRRSNPLTTLLHDKRTIAAISITVVCVGAISYAIYMSNKRLVVNPVTYTPLLQLIARVESKGNYNAYFGNVRNTSIDFTAMSIADVLAWQADYVRQGSPSDAVGRYQIISPTLRSLVQQLGIDTSRKFDRHTQDTFAIALLERRGSQEYVNNELARHDFAANLAKEWAALPKVTGANPEASYYASDGLNKSLVGTAEVLRAVEHISAK